MSAIVLDADYVVTMWNPTAENRYGISETSAVGKRLFDLIDIGGSSNDWAAIRRIVEREGSYHGVESHTGPSGVQRWMDWSILRISDPPGETGAMILVANDVSECRAQQQRLEKSEAQYRLLADHAADIVFTMDKNLRFTYISPSARRIRGISTEAAMKGNLAEILLPDSLEFLIGEFRKEMEIELSADADPERTRTFRLEIRAWGGGTLWVEANVTALRNAAGGFDGIVGVARDITERRKVESELETYRDHLENLVALRTSELQEANRHLRREIQERKRAEERLRKEQDTLRQIIEFNPYAIEIKDAEGRHKSCNQAFIDMWGHPAPPEFSIFEDPILRELGISKRLARVKRGEVARIPPHWYNPADVDPAYPNRRIHHSVITFPIFEIDGNIESFVFIHEDLTERKLLEERRKSMEARLQQQQRLESLGTLASGVAHEINNPVNIIMNFAELIQARADRDPESLRDYAGHIVGECHRVGGIVRNLLRFARQETDTTVPVSAREIVEDTVSLIRNVLIKDQIRIEVDAPEKLPEISCRSQQIQQVLMNLLTNARDSLNEKYPGFHEEKAIRVRVETATPKSEGDAEGPVFLRFSVEDRGMGIRPEVLDRIFDPFYTTKPRDRGTGLGLSVSHGIVKEHGGTLDVESLPGEYARFHFNLPVHRAT